MGFFSLDGRVAIVTGAARGIGKAIAERLSAAGASVVIVDMDLPGAEGCAHELSGKTGRPTLAVRADIVSPADTKAMVKATTDRFGRLDILVNNAAIAGKAAPMWETSAEEFRKVVDINLTGTFLCCQAALEPMRAAKYGRIVNIASVAGKEGNPNMIAYSAGKAAVINLTKALAKEVVKDGVIVNCVTPAVIHTPMLDQLTPEQVKYMTDRIPMGRTGKPEEVAALVHFLSSEDLSFSTGAAFDISGGRTTY